MAEERHTAEKDLLKIIENPAEASPTKPQETVMTKAPSSPKRGLLNLGKGARGFDIHQLIGNRKAVIQVLLIAAVCVFVYFLVNIFTEYGRLKKAKQIVVQQEKVEEMEVPAGSISLEEAVERTGEELRNIFKPYERKVMAEKVEKQTTTLENYKLVGISIEVDPKHSYAMVENVKTNAVSFLRKGERLEGMELVEILENKLTLKSEGQTIELR